MIVTFNYYQRVFKEIDEDFVSGGPTDNFMFASPHSYDAYYWSEKTPLWLNPLERVLFTSKKYHLLADNYTDAGIVIDSDWYIDLRNIFIVIPNTGDPDSSTAYLDCIKLSKFHALHYRDKEVRLKFYTFRNFVTEADSTYYFKIVDNTVLNYYHSMVDIYYPPIT